MNRESKFSTKCDPLNNVRHYGAQSRLTPSERDLLDALVEHGGVTKMARALGLSPKATGSRMTTIRAKIGAANSAEAIALWVARRDAA